MRRKRPYTEPDRIKERIRVVMKMRKAIRMLDRVDFCSICKQEQPVPWDGLSVCCKSFLVTSSRARFEEDSL